jgi:hypothetical protein
MKRAREDPKEPEVPWLEKGSNDKDKKEVDEEKEKDGPPSPAQVERRRLAAKKRADEHWKEINAVRRLEERDKKNKKYVICNEEEDEECLETFSYDELYKSYESD